MKTKHLLILGLIFAALFGLSIIQKARENQTPAADHRSEVWKPLIPVEQVARIVFSKPKQSPLSLSRDSNGWKVDSLSGVAADSQKVNEILNQLNQIRAEWRAEGEDFFERFGVGDEKAFHLQILNADGGALLDFYVGVKRAGQGGFIRLPGKPKIFFVDQDLPALFGLYADLEPAVPLPIFFVDLRLVPETFEQIQRFEVTEFRDGKKTTLAALERPSTEAGMPWKFVADINTFSPGFEKVEDYLAKLTGAHGENIAPPQAGFKPDLEIMLRDEKGKVLRLEFSKIKNPAAGGTEHWFVKKEGQPQIFEVSAMVVDDLKVQDAGLIQDNPLRIEIDQGYAVELQDGQRTDSFSHAAGWPSAAAILDAVSRLRFLGTEPGISVKDLQGFPPTHKLKIKRLGVDVAELDFYAADPQLSEIKTVIAGQSTVYIVSRAFFETIFIPENVPPVADAAPSAIKTP